MMNLLLKVIGIALMIYGVYLLGQNIEFTTNINPYWWRGIRAKGSVLLLTGGVLMLFFVPGEGKYFGIAAIALGVILVFFSSNVILKPTTLWRFLGSLFCLIGGYKLVITGRV